MIEVLIVLIAIGVLLYLSDRIPMDDTIRTILKVVVIMFVLLWLARVFGILDIPVPRVGR